MLVIFVSRLRVMCEKAITDPSLPDELLFGRAGVLFALLFLRESEIGESAARQESHGKGKVNVSSIEEIPDLLVW